MLRHFDLAQRELQPEEQKGTSRILCRFDLAQRELQSKEPAASGCLLHGIAVQDTEDLLVRIEGPEGHQRSKKRQHCVPERHPHRQLHPENTDHIPDKQSPVHGAGVADRLGHIGIILQGHGDPQQYEIGKSLDKA